MTHAVPNPSPGDADSAVGPALGRDDPRLLMTDPTCKLVCTGCGLEMPYRDRALAEQAAELHQLRDPEHVTFIVPPEWSPEEPVTHEPRER